MKVVDFIKRLNEIGYDENTELTFSCVNGDNGEYFEILPDADIDSFCYGEDLDGNPYTFDQIDFELNVDDCEEYLKQKRYCDLGELTEELINVIGKYESKHSC